MNDRTRKITLSALFAAFSVFSLYIASVWPTGQLGLTAIASLFVAAAIIESGKFFGIYVYIVSSVVAFMIVPNRLPVFFFILIFGYYPIIKSVIEKLKVSVIVQIILKLIVFNFALTFIWFFIFNGLFIATWEIDLHIVLIYVFGNVVFLLFDFGFTKLIWFYINRVSRIINKNR